jgi:HSP20 family molecular chaperone IbpA
MTDNNKTKQESLKKEEGDSKESALKSEVKKIESGCENFISTSKSFFCSKSSIAIIFALLGVIITILFQNIAHTRGNFAIKQEVKELKKWANDFDKMNQNHQKMLANVNEDPLLGAKNIFEEMTAMEERMNDIFARHHQYMKQAFKQAVSNSSNAKNTNIIAKEDSENYQYELNFTGFKKEDIIVNVKNNLLTFLAKQEKIDKNKDNNFKSASNFYYSFLIPADLANKEPEILRQENKITVKFKKKK